MAISAAAASAGVVREPQMNILLVTDLYPANESVPPDEVSRALHEFARVWVAEGNEVFVLRPRPLHLIKSGQIPRASKGRVDGIRVLSFPHVKMPGSDTVLVPHVRLALKAAKYRPDVVVGHLMTSLTAALDLAKTYGCPAILGIHRSDIAQPDRLRPLVKRADGVAYRSKSVERRARDLLGSFDAHQFVAPSGVDEAIVESPERFAEKAQAIAAQGKLVFTTVSRLLPLKNVDVTLEVLSRLNRTINWEFRVVGSGPEEARLRAITKQLGLENRVVFTGTLPHKRVLGELDGTHIFVMISAPETFGISYLEAMARAAVVVGARGEGIDGLIEDGKNGFLCPPRDADRLQSCITRIATLEVNELRKIQEEARQTILQHTVEKTGKHYLEHINLIVDRHKAKTSPEARQ